MANFEDFGTEEAVPLRFLLTELLELVDDVVDQLGVRQEIEFIHTMLKAGASADRQLRVYRDTEWLESVVDMLAEETVTGC